MASKSYERLSVFCSLFYLTILCMDGTNTFAATIPNKDSTQKPFSEESLMKDEKQTTKITTTPVVDVTKTSTKIDLTTTTTEFSLKKINVTQGVTEFATPIKSNNITLKGRELYEKSSQPPMKTVPSGDTGDQGIDSGKVTTPGPNGITNQPDAVPRSTLKEETGFYSSKNTVNPMEGKEPINNGGTGQVSDHVISQNGPPSYTNGDSGNLSESEYKEGEMSVKSTQKPVIGLNPDVSTSRVVPQRDPYGNDGKEGPLSESDFKSDKLGNQEVPGSPAPNPDPIGNIGNGGSLSESDPNKEGEMSVKSTQKPVTGLNPYVSTSRVVPQRDPYGNDGKEGPLSQSDFKSDKLGNQEVPGSPAPNPDSIGNIGNGGSLSESDPNSGKVGPQAENNLDKGQPEYDRSTPKIEMGPIGNLFQGGKSSSKSLELDEGDVLGEKNEDLNDFDGGADNTLFEVPDKGKTGGIKAKPIATDDSATPSSGHFMAYFVTATVFVVIGYITYHNRAKIFGLLLEGRNGRSGTRRRPNSGKYQQLNTQVEDALPGLDKKASSQNFIY